MKDRKNIRIHTKVDANTFRTLKEKCNTGGFRSVYQLMQTLLVGFCRYTDTDYDKTFSTGMRKEIDEMFDELMKSVPQELSHTTDRRSRR